MRNPEELNAMAMEAGWKPPHASSRFDIWLFQRLYNDELEEADEIAPLVLDGLPGPCTTDALFDVMYEYPWFVGRWCRMVDPEDSDHLREMLQELGAEQRMLFGRHIRGLTLWRPWPWAFTHADKRVENRTWAPPDFIVGHYIALHAGKSFDDAALASMRSGRFGKAAESVPAENAHAHSVIVAIALVAGAYRLGEGSSDTNPWAFGPYVWQLEDLFVLPEPVRCRGTQGLWRLPADAFAAVAAQFAKRPK